jgi:hypothetical protein
MVTIPQVDAESQHMIDDARTSARESILHRRRQMSVSYPTDTMEFEARCKACAETTVRGRMPRRSTR